MSAVKSRFEELKDEASGISSDRIPPLKGVWFQDKNKNDNQMNRTKIIYPRWKILIKAIKEGHRQKMAKIAK